MRTLVVMALLASGAAGCGSTQILTTEPDARIFVDGRALGQGHASIDKRGTPGSTTVVVKTADGRQQQSVVERSFTGTTLVAGLFTYGICLFACWEYPDTVFIPLPESPRATASLPLATAAAADPWMTPPAGWRPRAADPPETAAASRTASPQAW
jgi:hypothetical protein